jgi:hypothetical protein
MNPSFAETVVDENWYRGRAAAMQRLLATISQELRRESFAPEFSEDAEASGKLWDLALFFLNEMNSCLAGVAAFAANVMGAAALETVLLLACLKYRSKVAATARWQKIDTGKSVIGFSSRLASNRVGLAVLFEIAKELEWLPLEGMSPRFRMKLAAMIGEEKIAAIEGGIPDVVGVSWILIILSTGVRNAVHPGRNIHLPLGDIKFMGMLSTMMILVVLGTLLEVTSS